MDHALYVVTKGVAVLGVYLSEASLWSHLPADVDLEPCPDPSKGWNGRGDDRGLSVRVVAPDVAPRGNWRPLDRS